MTDRASRAGLVGRGAPHGGDGAPAPGGPAVRWERTGWDDPRVAALRAAMDADMAVRYADLLPQVAAMVDPPGTAWVTTWLALVDDEPAATATLRWLGSGPGRRAEVKKVFVAPAGRRRGLAREALRRVEGSARALGVRELHLHTGERQPEALALYAGEGWVEEPVFAPYDVLGISVCLRKDLAG